MGVDDAMGNTQTQSRAVVLQPGGIAGVEQERELGRVDARAVVANFHEGTRVEPAGKDFDPGLSIPRLDRVAQYVYEDLLHFNGIDEHGKLDAGLECFAIGLQRVGLVLAHQGEVGRRANRSDRIVDLVGDSRRQGADRGEALDALHRFERTLEVAASLLDQFFQPVAMCGQFDFDLFARGYIDGLPQNARLPGEVNRLCREQRDDLVTIFVAKTNLPPTHPPTPPLPSPSTTSRENPVSETSRSLTSTTLVSLTRLINIAVGADWNIWMKRSSLFWSSVSFASSSWTRSRMMSKLLTK